jgi:hypothetical protein
MVYVKYLRLIAVDVLKVKKPKHVGEFVELIRLVELGEYVVV